MPALSFWREGRRAGGRGTSRWWERRVFGAGLCRRSRTCSERWRFVPSPGQGDARDRILRAMSEHGTGSGPAPQAGLASSGTSTGTSKPASSSASTTTPKTIGEPLITVRGVNKFFGDFQALKDIDLDIRRREVVALIGASGSGKSTLCRCLNRLETVTDGEITIDGQPLPEEGKALTALRSDVGMVFQSFNLFPHLKAIDNVTLGPRRVRGASKAEAEAQARELLERVGLSD